MFWQEGHYVNYIIKKKNKIEIGKSFLENNLKTERWTILDSSLKIQSYEWFQNGELFYKNSILGHHAYIDSFMNDVDILLIDKAKVNILKIYDNSGEKRWDIKISNPGYPLIYTRISINELILKNEYLDLDNSWYISFLKSPNKEEVKLEVEYLDNYRRTIKTDSFQFIK